MKAPKVLFASLLALSTAGVAQAQTVIHITGSTAFRNATVSAITNILQPGFTFAYSGTSFTGANQAIFTGTAITNGISVIIKTSWSGAAGGVQTVVQQLPIATWLTNTTAQSTGGTPSAPAVYDPPAPPEVSMDDGIQATTPLPNTSSPVLTVQNVGAVTFKFIKNVGAPAGLTNMTPLMAQALWANGSLPLSMWTGNTNDASTIVYATGRDPDSGTRKVTFLETGIQNYVTGVTPSTVLQYEPTNASGVVNRAMGLSDSATAITGGATALAWNGIEYTDAAIQNGQYTFWAYEQLGYLPTYGTTSANGKAVADSLAQEIINVDAALAGELLSTMNVTRTQEGGPVTPQ
jgi:hypothetical protein